MTKDDFEAAIEMVRHNDLSNGVRGTVIAALTFAARVMEESSDGMAEAAFKNKEASSADK